MLRLTAAGNTAKEAAKVLRISPATVEVHHRNIRDKLSVKSMAHAVAVAFRGGVLAGLCALTVAGAWSGHDGALRVRRGGSVRVSRVQRVRREWEWPHG